MPQHKSRFRFEVHLGLLVIVFTLLCLNFVSNFVLFRARESLRSAAAVELNSAALAVSRAVQSMIPPGLTEARKHELMLQHELSGIIVIPFKPPDSEADSKKRWFQSIAQNLPPGQIPDLAGKLIAAEYQTLTRGENYEYFYVYPIPAVRGQSLIILSKNITELAYLDDSGRIILISAVVSMTAIVGIYLLLSRFIFAPFQKIKREALKAGRTVDQSEDDVEALVADYRQIIDELQAKEAELVQLNRAIQQKADSLEQFNDYLLTSINSGIVTISANGAIMSINRAGAELLSVDPREYASKSHRDLFHGAPELLQDIQEALVRGKSSKYREIDYSSESGTVRTLGTSVSMVFDSARQPMGASIVIHDLTELKRLRSELEINNRLSALGEMAGGLAHQLRNSMGAITGYCNLLKKRLTNMGVETGSLDALAQEADEAEKLVGRFLQFARPFDYTPQPVSINELIDQVIDSFRTREDCRRVECLFPRAADVTVEMDPLLIKQALTNILENAVNAYEGKRGSVEIKVTEDVKPTASGGAPVVHVEVQDYGCGIAEEDLDKIFTPFFSSRPSGTGLGLPLARKIVDLHQGSLTVKSQLGKGTTATISLPKKSQPQAKKYSVKSLACAQ